MADCWTWNAYNRGFCTPGWIYDWVATINTLSINPLLPFPSFIPKDISGMVNCRVTTDGAAALVASYTQPLWGHFCDPPRAQYPITNIGAFPATPTPYAIDIARSPSTLPLPEYYLDRGFAIACRIIPTSKCLPYIMFHNAYNQVAGQQTIIEIRKNDPATNLPVGIPGDNNIFGRVAVVFPVNYANYAVPINTILDEIDAPVWVVLYSDDYACSDAFVGSANRRLKLSKSDAGTNNIALFNQANGCAWAIDPTVNSIALTTYKAAACSGTVIVTDFAFAKIAQPPIYLNDNCFVRLVEVDGANVGIGVKYTNPDPARAWRRVRFSFAYKKPDLRYFTGTAELLDVAPGQHETFFEMNDPFFAGIYKELNITALVIQT